MTKPTTSTFKRQLSRRIEYLTAVRDGLDGRPFSYGDGAGSAAKRALAPLGVTLVTATWLAERGYVLNRGAKPVGSIYFPSPISKSCHVYVLECQAWLADPAKLERVEAKARERKAKRSGVQQVVESFVASTLPPTGVKK